MSLSYGKDSLACLGAIEELGLPLDRIVHAEVWATDTIPADLPPMVEFKAKADAIIKERWGITVEHQKAGIVFEQGFFTLVGKSAKPKYRGKIRGWPLTKGSWCLRDLKISSMPATPGRTYYIGIAADETERHGQLSDLVKSPLVKAGWKEADCELWCVKQGLLSPIYASSGRGGCWFCPKQPIEQLRILYRDYPEYWRYMLKWDKVSHVSFRADGHTIHDFDRRFQAEDMGLIAPDDKGFR